MIIYKNVFNKGFAIKNITGWFTINMVHDTPVGCHYDYKNDTDAKMDGWGTMNDGVGLKVK